MFFYDSATVAVKPKDEEKDAGHGGQILYQEMNN